ncbi:insulinase family protein, partial [Arthrospira platensis SPKY1]|nr:insulinase family protein [Arthrospira platensis SPKY1]
MLENQKSDLIIPEKPTDHDPVLAREEAMLSVRIPIDPSFRTGVLENGLHYFIRRNTKPEDRAELRLVVRAGSIYENDDEKGFAHFIEHMQFNGTKNFTRNDMVHYLEKIGTRFGPDLNAYT